MHASFRRSERSTDLLLLHLLLLGQQSLAFQSSNAASSSRSDGLQDTHVETMTVSIIAQRLSRPKLQLT